MDFSEATNCASATISVYSSDIVVDVVSLAILLSY
jgi:hypothetical protein